MKMNSSYACLRHTSKFITKPRCEIKNSLKIKLTINLQGSIVEMNTHAQKKYKCKKFSSQTSLGGEIYSSWRNHEERAIEIARHY